MTATPPAAPASRPLFASSRHLKRTDPNRDSADDAPARRPQSSHAPQAHRPDGRWTVPRGAATSLPRTR
eukprot:7946646-Alexandrium_andersonii.AAC.1